MDGFPNMGTKERTEPPPGGTWAHAAAWEPAKIPRRPWIAHGYLMRGAITAVVGAGGVSKSMLMLAYGVALVLGQNWHCMKPLGEYRVAIFNAEDDDDEQKRRLTAVLTKMGKTPADLAGKLLRTGPERAATLLHRDPDTQELKRTPAMRKLVEDVTAFGADVLILDPFAELHTEEENANVALREVVAEFRALARELGMAIVLVHHTRKGQVEPGDMDAARGASSVVNAARVGLTVVGMTAEDAKAFGLATGTHRHYFRLDGGKNNHASLTECEWFERSRYELEQGDDAAVPVPWNPPVDTLTLEKKAELTAALEQGSPTGPWSPKLENRSRSLKLALVQAGIITGPGQRDALEALYADGFTKAQFRDAIGNGPWGSGPRTGSRTNTNGGTRKARKVE